MPIAGSRLDWDKPRCFSQSAESRQVSALEHDLKVPLFHRHPPGLVLTGQGELLLLRAAREDELVHTEKLWKNAIATKRRDMGITLVPGHDLQHRRSQHSAFFRNIGGKGVNVGLFPRPDLPKQPDPILYDISSVAVSARCNTAGLRVQPATRALRLWNFWRGFRTFRGALWVGWLTRLRFPGDWLTHSQGPRSSNTPRLCCAVSDAEPSSHSPASQIDAEPVTAPGVADATEMRQRVPLRFYPSASRRPRLGESRLAGRRYRDAFHPFAWGDDRCAGKRHVMAILAVGSALIFEIVPGPR